MATEEKLKLRARHALNEAIRSGKIIRPDSCSRCGGVPQRRADGRATILGHQVNYDRPFDVEWVCFDCRMTSRRMADDIYRGRLRQRIENLSIPEPNSGCWIWLGAVRPDGYGGIGIQGKRKSTAHRASYAAFNAPIPIGKVVMHMCDNYLCVNPDHLRVGTYKDNTADMIAKGRAGFQRRALSQSPDRESGT